MVKSTIESFGASQSYFNMKPGPIPSTSEPITPSTTLTGLPASGLIGHIHSALQATDTTQASKMKKRIKLLLVDDHPVVRKGIASCLTQQDHLQIVGEAADGREAL